MLLSNLMTWSQSRLLFHPTYDFLWRPDYKFKELLIPVDKKSHKTIVLKSPLIKETGHPGKYIHAWHFDKYPKHKTVLFCHGNTGNISHRKYIIDFCLQLELNLLIFDYRGYGLSCGFPSKHNLREDVQGAYDYLRQSCVSEDIVVWGESLGGFPAVWVASQNPCRSLLLLSTFSSIDDAICYGLEGSFSAKFFKLILPLLADNLPNYEYIRQVEAPVVILYSKDDTLINYRCSEKLFDNVSHQNKLLIEIKGDHAEPDISLEQIAKMFLFCDISVAKYRKQLKLQEMLTEVKKVASQHFLVEKQNCYNLMANIVSLE